MIVPMITPAQIEVAGGSRSRGGGGKIAPRSKEVDPHPRASLENLYIPVHVGIYDFRSFWSLGISWRIGMQTYLLKADAEFFARIDAVAGRGKRAEWIRVACEARLSGGDRAPALVPGGVIPDAALEGFDRVAVPVRKVSSSEATAAILDGTMKPRPVVRRPGKRDWSGDYERVLGVVRERLRSSRELASDLGWAETRVEAVVSAMELEGLVRFERGGVVAV